MHPASIQRVLNPNGSATLDRTRQPSTAASSALLIGALGVVSLGAGQLSLAVFTDQETVPGTFSSGSVILDDVKIDALTLSTAGMVPGDTVTDDVVVENDGSVQLRYALSTTEHEPGREGPARRPDPGRQGDRRQRRPGTPCNDFDGVIVLDRRPSSVRAAQASAIRRSAPRRATGRWPPRPTRRCCFRVTLPSGDGQRLPGRDDHDDLHVRRRADLEQPVTMAMTTGSASAVEPVPRPHAPGRMVATLGLRITLLRRLLGVLWLASLATVVLLALVANLGPRLGLEVFAIRGGSMAPTIPLGAAVIAVRTPTGLDPGRRHRRPIRADNGVVFTHRVVEVDDSEAGRLAPHQGGCEHHRRMPRPCRSRRSSAGHADRAVRRVPDRAAGHAGRDRELPGVCGRAAARDRGAGRGRGPA